MSVNIDTSDLKSFIESLETIQKHIDEGYEYMLKTVAGRYLTDLIELSPVDTGTLRRGWVGLQIEKGAKKKKYPKPSAGEQKKHIDDKPINRNGSSYNIIIDNNIEYTASVNYGHVLPAGESATGSPVWVAGQHFIEQAQSQITPMLSKLYPRLFNQWCKKILGN